MKKLLFAVAAMFVATACISENIDVSVPETNLVPVELCIEDNATRLDVDGNVVTWEVGDKCSVQFTGFSTTQFVTFEITSASQILDNGKRAKFTGMVPEGSYLRAVAFYPGVATDSDNLAMNEHAQQNVFMGAVNDYADGLVVAQGKPLTLTMTFEHLLHKIDYKLTGDVNHSNIAVEMVVTSNGNPVDLIQFGGYDMYSGTWSSKATTQSHFTAIEDHNFASEPIASAMVFPFTASNAELLFNVYIDGKKEYAITKKPSASTFKMSAGKSSTINLALTEDNRVEIEADSGSSGPSVSTDFAADYYLTSFMSTSAYDGNPGYIISLEGGANVTIYFTADIVTDGVLTEGDYKYCTSAMSLGYGDYANDSFSFRKNNSFFPSIGLTDSTSLKSASAKVSKDASGNYYIDLTLTDANSRTAKVQYIGPLNVDDGGIIPGESGGAGGSSGPVDIELTSLTAKGSTNGCYSFAGVDANGNKIDLLVNPADATANTLSRGLVEYTSSNYAANEGLFHAKNIVLNGSSRSDVLSGMMHVTSASGNNVNLSVNLNFSDGTSQRYTFGGAIVTTVVDDSLTLTASKSTITANGSDYVSFTVMQSGADVTSQCVFYVNGSAILDDVFSTKNAGSYTVYAKKGGVESNHITITAEAVQPIVLSASKTTLVANNSDSVTFTVKQGTTNVSSYAQIWVNGVRNNGTTFTASSAGTYSVYATYDGVTSNTITLTATAPDSSNLVILFADGVTRTTGWYDVNKKAKGDNGDINMCWAAAASNMIQWWQDRYVAAGKTLPSGATTGVGTTSYTNYGPYELELMNMFLTEWNNDKGCQTVEAIPWYFQGVNYGESASEGSQAYPLTAGGYWKGVWSDIYPKLYHDYNYMFYWYTDLYTGSFLAYTGWDEACSSSGPKYGTNTHLAFSNRVIEFLERGVTELTISINSTGGLSHATTLWGCEYDQTTGLVTRIWITDSDDLESEPKQQLLNEYAVSTIDGNYRVKLTGNTKYGTVYANELQPLSGYGSK